MKAIVIVFMPSRNGQVASEPGPVNGRNGAGGLEVAPPEPKTDLLQLPSGDQITPPFWTWFVENPRRVSL